MNKTILLIGLLSVIVLLGCRRSIEPISKPRQKEEQNKLVDSLTNALGEVRPSAQIDSVRVYLENSSSMGGYFLSATRFFGAIDLFLVSLARKNFYGNSVRAYTIAEETIAYPSIDEFRRALSPLNNEKMKIANSSPLDIIMGTILSNSGSNDVSVLITDAIMSGTNKQLVEYDDPKKGKYFNIDFTERILKPQIISELAPYTEDYAMKVLAFKSNFLATKAYPYYKLDNNNTDKLNKTREEREALLGEFSNRPYYLLIFGKQDHIKSFIKQCENILSPEESLEFGFNYNSSDVFRLTHLFRGIRNCSIDPDNKQLILEEGNMESGASINFGVLLNMPQLEGANEAELNAFADKVLVLVNDQPIQKTQIEIKNANNSDVIFISSNNLKYRKGFSHVLSIEISEEIFSDGDVIKLQVINKLPEWYQDWSSDSDLNITLNDDRTFAFNYFIEGIASAYKAGNAEEVQVEYDIKVKSQ